MPRKDKPIICQFERPSFNKEIFWHQWSRDGGYNEMASARRHGNERSMDESRKENQKRIDEKCQIGTIAEAVNCFQEKLPDSLIHVYKTMTPRIWTWTQCTN